MLTEKDMEDAIARDPKRYLGEDGLELIERQYRIGGYIFDLLFKDRHGAKLIVEIQRGTLDRAHTYKILGFRKNARKGYIHGGLNSAKSQNRILFLIPVLPSHSPQKLLLSLMLIRASMINSS